ncbi:MAG: hypothetical protein H7X93_14280 [Sphingomonadaceae bacterium]|nr:hypothetical protein [Sphingomonadaceae bacterium]
MTDSRFPAPPPEADEDDPLAFGPVPTASSRHDGWTPHRQRQLIAALAAMGVVSRAAKAVGMSAASAYKLRDRPGAESFRLAWDTALQMARDHAFGYAMDRALNGYTRPRYYRGRQIGTIHSYDHRLMIAALMPPSVPPHRRGGSR